MLLNKALRLAIASACALSLSAIGQPAAQAAPWSGTEYIVKELSRTPNQIDANQILGSCSGGKGYSCSLTSSFTASRTIDLQLGVTASFVSTKLNLGAAQVTVSSASCTWVLPTNSSRLVAYPLGEQVFFKVTKNIYTTGKLQSSQTSGTLSAFKPYPGSLFCARIR